MTRRKTAVKPEPRRELPAYPQSCSDGCGKTLTNWTQACLPQPWWDSPGLPPRPMADRCSQHTHCAYRDDDPARCAACHASTCCCGKTNE